MADESFVFYFPAPPAPTPPDEGTPDLIHGGFGTGPFGSMPFGTAFAAEPIVLSAVYAEAVAVDTIRIYLNIDAVVNDEYKKLSNYSLVDSNGNKQEIRAVMFPFASDTYPFVQLHVRNLIESQTYQVVASNLISRKGYELTSSPLFFTYWRTKIDSVVQSIPDIYDTTAEANIRAMLTAIGLEDNIIAGSPDGIEENV